MAEPQIELTPTDFCELKHTLEDAHKTMSSDQLLEVADDMHEEIRDRGDDPRSGPSNCTTGG
jgi:DNA-binding response OmpR family regulator